MKKKKKGIVIILIFMALIPIIWHFTLNNKGETNKAETSDQASKTEAPAVKAVVTETSSDKLLGKWLRPDGNYILEIVKISDQVIEAKYFNPNPINVARAELLRAEGLKIQVEFADTNYEGSTYDLVYDPQQDALIGTYYQATYGQTYQVGFIRHNQ